MGILREILIVAAIYGVILVCIAALLHHAKMRDFL